MRIYSKVASVSLLSILAACTPKEPSFCTSFNGYVNALPSGQSHKLILEMHGDWQGDYYRACDSAEADYDAGRNLCGYLLKKTSIQFMGTNITQILACLTGHEKPTPNIIPGLKTWVGTLKLSPYHLTQKNVTIEVDYRLGSNEEEKGQHITLLIQK